MAGSEITYRLADCFPAARWPRFAGDAASLFRCLGDAGGLVTPIHVIVVQNGRHFL
jgi:hypothetical protein